MDIIITGDSVVPLYEQIENQLKEQILQGKLEQGSSLPSIRMMAKELKVSIITVKRAYEELEQEGFIETAPGKGSFVSMANKEWLMEIRMSQLEDQLAEVIATAKGMDMSLEELQERVQLIYEEE